MGDTDLEESVTAGTSVRVRTARRIGEEASAMLGILRVVRDLGRNWEEKSSLSSDLKPRMIPWSR